MPLLLESIACGAGQLNSLDIVGVLAMVDFASGIMGGSTICVMVKARIPPAVDKHRNEKKHMRA